MLQNERDVSNIKLIDFGLSKDLKAGMKQKSLVSGTPFYIAPEVINRIVTPASDIWSAGVVMYVCLTGRLPFPGNDIDEIFHTILNKDIGEYLDTHFAHLSLEVKDLIIKCLNKNHMERVSASEAYRHPWFDLCEGSEPYQLSKDLQKKEGLLRGLTRQLKEQRGGVAGNG